MFRKTRIKIVVTIMSALVILWLVSHTGIYLSYVQEYSRKNYELLKEQAYLYTAERFSENINGEQSDDYVSPSRPETSLATFYTVAFSDNGEIFETMNDKPAVRSNEELERLAREIVYERENNIGMAGQLTYYHIDKGEYNLVVFMDNTLVIERIASMMRYAWICTGVVFALFFVFSILIADMIVRPLEKNYKYQKEFISNAGHELKTPVSVISANAEMLERKIGNDKWLDNIQYENDRMGVLVGHLLELSRTETVPAEMEIIDLSRLVQGEVLPFESVAFEKGLVINSDIASDVKVYGNSTQLKQVVSVLVENAIQHCNFSSPEINLLLKKDGLKYARISVINSGDEISKEDREKIFERFYRVDAAQSTNNKNYGLGLAIAKNIVKSHKGKIKVWCYDGKVEFQVFIPLSIKRKKKFNKTSM